MESLTLTVLCFCIRKRLSGEFAHIARVITLYDTPARFTVQPPQSHITEHKSGSGVLLALRVGSLEEIPIALAKSIKKGVYWENKG